MEHILYLDGNKLDHGKAIQFYVDNQPFLVLGSSSRIHVDIMSRALDTLGISYRKVYLYGPDFGPPLEDPAGRYKIVGAGWANLRYRGRIVLEGHSSTYRIHPNKKHAAEITALLQDMVVEVKEPEPVVSIKPVEKKSILDEDGLPF